jgi:hypothetical protein
MRFPSARFGFGALTDFAYALGRILKMAKNAEENPAAP